jgi:Ca2+-binding RTX toxin-like protein
MQIDGTSGNDTLPGTATTDTFDLSQGGSDIAMGLAGNDSFNLGAAFDALDAFDGGADYDWLRLDGDYSAGVVFTATTLLSFAEVYLFPGHSYSLTLHDETVAAGASLILDGGDLGAAHSFILHAETETDGKISFNGGFGSDAFYGGTMDDAISLHNGGDDIASGFDGFDVFYMQGSFTAADRLDGGPGVDHLRLDGDYSAGVIFDDTTAVNFEAIQMFAGHNYRLKATDSVVAANKSIIVTAGDLSAGHWLYFDGTAELDGGFQAVGGAGADTLIGGQDNDQLQSKDGDDLIEGGQGDDIVDGDNGTDTASYAHASSGVTVDLSLGIYQTVGGGQGSDILLSIENLIGGNGNDSFTGNSANNRLDGGAGDDTANFAQSFANFTLQDFGGLIVVSGPEGTDTLVGIEHLHFADITITPVDDGNPLFDALHYLSQNPDVLAAGVDPLFHFNNHGWREGRDPNAFFDVSGYLAVNKDVAKAGLNPLAHYHQSGWHEGRDPSADFDTTLYLINNPDVAAAGVDPLLHYLEAGRAEGRAAYAAVGKVVGGFDAQYYLLHNPDVAAAGVDPLAHFNTTGWHEGRNPNPWFDSTGYLSHNTDVAAAGVNPLQHYMQSGWLEGRDPSAAFDTLGYLSANPDVAAAGMNPLTHFLSFGIYEGRQPVNDGTWF